MSSSLKKNSQYFVLLAFVFSHKKSCKVLIIDLNLYAQNGQSTVFELILTVISMAECYLHLHTTISILF